MENKLLQNSLRRALFFVFVILLLVIVVSNPLRAQDAIKVNDILTSSGTGNMRISATVSDSKGATYMAGSFWGIQDFDPGPGSHIVEADGDKSDMFLIKLDANGEFEWGHDLGYRGVVDSVVDTKWRADELTSLFIDENDNIYIGGFFGHEIDFDPGVGSFVLDQGSDDFDHDYGASSFQQAVIASYAEDGMFRWAQSYGASEGPDRVWGIDGSGAFVYAVGTTTTEDGSYPIDPFIWKLDTSGTEIWNKKIDYYSEPDAGQTWELGNANLAQDIAVADDGSVYVMGTFNDSLDFDLDATELILSTTELSESYLARYDATGQVAWAMTISGAVEEFNSHLRTTPDNKVLVANADMVRLIDANGVQEYEITFEGMDEFSDNLLSNVEGGVFYSAFTVDNHNAQIIDGMGDTLEIDQLSNNATPHVAKFNLDGSVVFEDVFGIDYAGAPAYNEPSAIHLQHSGQLVLGTFFHHSFPYYNSSEAMYDSAYTHTGDGIEASAASWYGAFLDDCTEEFKVAIANGCDAYKLPDGQVFYETGEYEIDYFNEEGCKSSMILNYTYTGGEAIREIEACDEFTWINGETYSESVSGIYYVEENESVCDTVVELQLTIFNSPTATENLEACPGDSVMWRDGNYYEIGEPGVFVVSNIDACDSVISVNVLDASRQTKDYQYICFGDTMTWIDGNPYAADTSVFYSFANELGCMSNVELDLTVQYPSDPVVSSLEFNGDTYLECSNSWANNYKWIACGNSDSIYAEGEDLYWIKIDEGDFFHGAVVVERAGCVETTECVSVGTIMGTNSLQSNQRLELVPNPTEGTIHLSGGAMDFVQELRIKDVAGRELKSLAPTNTLFIEGKPGVYFIELYFEDGSLGRERVVKK